MTDITEKVGIFAKIFAEKAGLAAGVGLSSSRILSAIVVLNCVALVDYLTIIHKALPELSTLTEFVTAIVGILYGVNKVTNVLVNRQNGPGS